MRGKIIIVPAVLSLVAIGLTGCGTNAGGRTTAGQTPHKAEGKPIALTTFTVLRDMTENVAESHLDARSVTKPGAEIHGYQPMPSDPKSAKDARLILNNDLDLERWLERFTTDLDAKTVDVSEGIKPIPVAEGDYGGKPNPHAWMSPKNDALYVRNIAKAFCDFGTANYNDYKASADKYTADIEKVGEDISTTLSSLDLRQRTLVSYEGTFSYLTRDCSPGEKCLWGVNAEDALIPSRVAEVENYVKESKVPAVFCESTVGKKMKPIIKSTSVKFSGELYVDSLSETGGDVSTHLDLLKHGMKLITDRSTGK